MIALANKVIECCRTLATFTEEPGRTTRTFLSPPMHDVHRHLSAWMRGLGMEVRVDAAGNLRGTLLGGKPGRIVVGSHLDTVPNAGAFDGILGVVMGVALVDAAQAAFGLGIPTIEVIGFSEEEGVRFGVPFIGSRAVTGSLEATPEMLDAIRAFGLDPAGLPDAKLAPDTTAYLEFHIEQGPVLESLNLPLAVVDTIVGQSRLSFRFDGKANHAGTTPMSLRSDALAAAAEWILEVEWSGGTVGHISVEPNAANVIPGLVEASLDLRHACDETRHAAVARLIGVAHRRELPVTHRVLLDQPAVPLDANLRDRLSKAVERAGYSVHHMDSGAGHDAMIIAAHIPSAMLFLRSPGGISHHPDESVLPEDVGAALEVGVKFLRHA